VNFLIAKRRTLHIFSENGRSIPVSLRERDGNVAVFESQEPIPLGVFVEWTDAQASECGQVLNCRPAAGKSSGLLEISVEFRRENPVA
jgi:hypothetical protein